MVCGAARLDELEFEPLVHRLKFDDAEQRADHVEAAVAVRPQPLHDAVCGLEVSLHASVQRLLDEQRVRLIAHLRVAGRARRAIRRRPHHHAPRAGTEVGGGAASLTLKTFSLEMRPKPACVACALFSAWRMSPSAVKMSASMPESLCGAPSASTTCISLLSTCSSVSFE